MGIYVPRGWLTDKFAKVVIDIKIDEEDFASSWRTGRSIGSIPFRGLSATSGLSLPSMLICEKVLEAGQHTISATFRSSPMSPEPAIEHTLLSMFRDRRMEEELTRSRLHTHHDRVSFKLKTGEFAKFAFDCRLRTRDEGQYYRYSITRM